MTKAFTRWPKIPSLKNLHKDFLRLHNKYGTPLPNFNFLGSIKLHGMNSAIVYNPDGTMHWQSRNHAITLADDKTGFANWYTLTVPENQQYTLRQKVVEMFLEDDIIDHTITIMGEFAGRGINKNMAIHELEKAFYIFGVSIESPDGIVNWLSFDRVADLSLEDYRIFNIYHFPTYFINVDFGNIDATKEDLDAAVNAVAESCPVARHFGVNSSGEGIVWLAETDQGPLRFKMVADAFKERISQPKERKAKDATPFQQAVLQFVVEARMEKVIASMEEEGIETTPKNTKIAMQQMSEDIWVEECLNLIQEFDANFEDVQKVVGRAAGGLYNRLL